MMKLRLNSYLRFCLLIALAGWLALLPATARPQGEGEAFEDPDGVYSLKLPKNWIAVVSKDGLGRNEVNIVYRGVREDGALKIRRLDVESGTKAMDAAKRDEDQTLRFRPGYSRGAFENFAANYEAAMLTYDYTQAGRPKMGRTYYLKAGDTVVYVLWFTGNRPMLGPLRAQTDAIARSFKLK